MTQEDLSGKFWIRMLSPQLLLLALPSHQHLAVYLQHLTTDTLCPWVSYAGFPTHCLLLVHGKLADETQCHEVVTFQM